MRRSLPFLFIFVLSFAETRAQPLSSAKNVHVETYLARDRAEAGTEVLIAFRAIIAEGWHVNSHTPTFEYLLATNLELAPRPDIILADLRYPQGSREKFDFAEQPIDVYSDTVTIFAAVRLASIFPAGPDTLRARLRVQSCNNQVCLAPSSIDISVPLNVVPAGTPTRELHSALFSAYTPSSSQTDDLMGGALHKRGSTPLFAAVFLIGLALNLTPCVYPMLSVTVSLFGTQTETNPVRVFVKAVIYVLGIATMYSTLGVSAALSGGLFGSWLQSPWVLGGIAALLFGLALSSFGVYQITIPYWLTSRLGGQQGTGMIGTYLSGLVVGVFAAPCVGPPVIALLTYVSAQADPVLGFKIFFALSLGLGFPYLILGTFSGLLKKIPRSGTWLVWVEHIFGVILIGAALFYLSLAVAPALASSTIPAVAVLGGIYLGFLDNAGKEKRILQRIQWMFGLFGIVLGLYLASALTEEGLAWESYSEQALADAKAHGQPVMMDFYADWCIPCLELDKKTFVNPVVKEAVKPFRRLKVDLTHFDSPESESLRKQYSISGVPSIVFLSAYGVEMRAARVVGFLTPEEFVAKVALVQ